MHTYSTQAHFTIVTSVVRHGHGPERTIQTGIAVVPVSNVRVLDRGASGVADRVRFTPSILSK